MKIRVPASSANLGSGFDALGLALALYDEVEVEPAGSGLTVSVTGEGADSVATDASHLVVRALRAGAERLGLELPGIVLRCANAVPHARGLGSSAAAIVAGVAAAYGLAGRDLDADALQLAAEFEGHADNVAASLLGGLVLAWREGSRYRAMRFEPHPDLRPVALVPAGRSATAETRGLLPDRVPHADAAFAAARCALAVAAITAEPDLLLAATEDRLHQDYRESAWPATMRVVRALRESGVAATVSGAGPTVLALTTDGKLPDVDLTGFTARELAVARTGVTVTGGHHKGQR
ncbi:MAG TPA: homoserine kinase [Actinophytocola sp.]|uniref:homoserine kinase n=1 Tax=Actinophytocola sp. TaxID=1872138 RepID=UPI002DBAA51E|nr:homoserine kinase [Actinophytocola sp.]HEU5470007.1 homoserine kinase [Actinophytocola sp.]